MNDLLRAISTILLISFGILIWFVSEGDPDILDLLHTKAMGYLK
jgi:hypothetical protein